MLNVHAQVNAPSRAGMRCASPSTYAVRPADAESDAAVRSCSALTFSPTARQPNSADTCRTAPPTPHPTSSTVSAGPMPAMRARRRVHSRAPSTQRGPLAQTPASSTMGGCSWSPSISPTIPVPGSCTPSSHAAS